MRRVGMMLLVLVCVAAGAAGTGAVLWRVLPQAAPWPILIHASDGNLVLAKVDGTTEPLTSDADGQGNIYLHPTPAPDGRSVASVAITHSQTTASASLVVHQLDGSRTTLYDEPASAPFYLSWSPDSQRLAFLAGSKDGMTLHGVDVGTQPNPRRITPGNPSYFAWSPDSQRLLLHTGGAAPGGLIQLYEWGAETPTRLQLSPTFFQAPVWSMDGERAIAGIEQNGAAALAAIDRSGTVLEQIATVHPSTMFVVSPDTQQIAYVASAGPNIGDLHLVNADGTDNRAVGDEPVVTMFWSPTGDRLAFLSISTGASTQPVAWKQQQEARLRWNVIDVRDGGVQSFDGWLPSREFLTLLPYFDQYAQSIRFWDRTGTRLLYGTDDGVYMLDVRSGGTTRLSDGVLGMWLER